MPVDIQMNFVRFCLLIVVLSASANAVLFRKSFPLPVSSKLSPTFSPATFKLSVKLRCLIPLELSFLQGDKYLESESQVSSLTTIVYRRCYLFSSLSFLISFGVWVDVWIFSLIPFIKMPVFLPITCCLFISVAL